MVRLAFLSLVVLACVYCKKTNNDEHDGECVDGVNNVIKIEDISKG